MDSGTATYLERGTNMKVEVALSYDEFVPPKKEVDGKTIGHEQCRVISEDVVFNIKGQRFQRMELRISGTLEGWAVKEGPRSNFFTDGPDFVFTQSKPIVDPTHLLLYS